MEIKRELYLNKMIRHKHNGMIKVITGIRRCGKSYLLFELFYKHLLSVGVPEDHILKIALDDRRNKKFRNPDYLCDYVHDYVKDGDMYYILLDEVQLVPEFEDVLNSFLHIKMPIHLLQEAMPNFYQRILLRNSVAAAIRFI